MAAPCLPFVAPFLLAAAPGNAPLTLFGIRLIGFTPHVLRQLIFTLVWIGLFLLVNRGLRALNWKLFAHRRAARTRFWVQQGVAIASTVTLVIGLISIWFENPAKLTTAAGLVSAGVAVALQRVVTSFAAYLVILRGKIFNVGDRIAMGGVRGDVVDLGFIRTTLLEMGQPPSEKDEPPVWVQSRQYTGRLVTVTNDKIFESPVYNYSGELDFLWEEMHVPVRYGDDWRRAEEIVLAAANAHGKTVHDQARDHLASLRHSYPLEPASLDPRTFIRLTDNWIDLAVRFVAPTHGVRRIKDGMSREVLTEFEKAGIQVASSTFSLAGAAPLRVVVEGEGDGAAARGQKRGAAAKRERGAQPSA